MAISIFDLFKIGIGPSSSHTVGPMKAAQQFVEQLKSDGRLYTVARVKSEMFGSLGATGVGHGTPKAVLLGLEGEQPESIVVADISARVAGIREQGQINLAACHKVAYQDETDLILNRRKELPFHSNGMQFSAYAQDGSLIEESCFYSVGGGFVVGEDEAGNDAIIEDARELVLPFSTGAELLEICQQKNLRISDVMWANEEAWRPASETRNYLHSIWQTMQECIDNGIAAEGILPGGLKVSRRAGQLYHQLLQRPEASLSDPLTVLDWVSLYALAVNEENAAGGRIVTAPTNGAAGIVPAVLNYYRQFVPGANDDGVERFLLTAAAVGILYKKNASISGAEVGCQGEVGSACSMAAAGLAEVLGATPEQVENAAEIAMEHNLGLTCDPIGGLVQVPCIERNAMASVKAIHAARMAIRGDGSHFVSLDKVIKTMRDTGRDMQAKYKETARGGLAINVVEVPVNIVEC